MPAVAREGARLRAHVRAVGAVDEGEDEVEPAEHQDPLLGAIGRGLGLGSRVRVGVRVRVRVRVNVASGSGLGLGLGCTCTVDSAPCFASSIRDIRSCNPALQSSTAASLVGFESGLGSHLGFTTMTTCSGA